MTTKNTGSVIFRVNGDKSIGYGHLIRCIALAEILKDSFQIRFYSGVTDPFMIAQIEKVAQLVLLKEGDPYYPDDIRSGEEISFDLPEVIDEQSIVVLDGYRFGTHYRTRIKELGAALVCIEDIANGFYPADVIISSNPLYTKADFKCLPETECRLGLSYSLLRKPFREKKNEAERKQRIFISMGGVDYYGIAPKLAHKILTHTDEQIAVVYTEANKEENIQWLLKLKKEFSDRVHLYTDLDGAQMVAIMDSCNRAVLPSSGVLIEALSRGLVVYTGFYSNNQMHLYNWFVENEVAQPLGDLCQRWDEISMHLQQPFQKSRFELRLAGNEDWIDLFHSLKTSNHDN